MNNSVLLSSKFSKFNDSLLKLDNYMISKIGLLKNKCFFKINDYTVYCVPFELSFEKCGAFAILNAKETEYFRTFTGKIISLTADFINPLFSKAITIFLRVTIDSLEIQKTHNKYCTIKASIKRPSDDYKAILTDQFIRLEYINKLYVDEEKLKIIFKHENFQEFNLDTAVSLKFEGNSIKYKGKIMEISFKQVKIFAEILKKDAENKKLTIEFFENENPVFAKGKVAEINESKEVQDFYILSIDYEFSFGIIDILSSLKS